MQQLRLFYSAMVALNTLIDPNSTVNWTTKCTFRGDSGRKQESQDSRDGHCPFKCVYTSSNNFAIVADNRTCRTSATALNAAMFEVTPGPTNGPTVSPTTSSTTSYPTAEPTASPASRAPTVAPTKNPSKHPTRNSTENPTRNPTKNPT